MTAIKIDRPAIFRDAWSRARTAAAAASEKVGQHIGVALRAAWASARMALQPVQQQQASAAPVEAISITATEAERLEAECSALREQKKAAFALLCECREERIAAVTGEIDACPGVCWTNEERAEAAADEATDALDRCLADYWEACDYLRDEEREERRTSLKARIAQGPAMVLQPVQQQQANAGTPSSGACEVCGRPLTDPVSIEAGIGPICRSNGHARRQLSIFDNRSDYCTELAGHVICITDLNLGSRSVTNDAEGVIRDLVESGYDLARMPVIYRDSTGTWDEMVVNNGRFAGFRHLDTARKEALRAIAMGLDVPPPDMVPQPVQQQQADAKAPAPRLSLEERRLALHNAGIRAINRGSSFMADYVEEHPRWRHDGKSTAVRVSTLAEAVTAGERLLAEYEATRPARGYEFNGKVYETAQACYLDMMDMEDGKGTSAFALVTGLVAFDRLTGARLSIDKMSDRFCAENGPAPEIDTAPDLSTAGGLAEVLVGRTANLRMTVGEVVYTISGVRRWTSPDGNLVRDYITLETFGKEADDRMGPVKLHIERAGGGRGSHGMTKAGMARWSYGAHCDSGSNQARADELVRELLANIVEV